MNEEQKDKAKNVCISTVVVNGPHREAFLFSAIAIR